MLTVFSFSCHLFGIPFKIMAMGGIDWKLLEPLDSLSCFLPFSSSIYFVACSVVPRILAEMYISSFYVFQMVLFPWV